MGIALKILNRWARIDRHRRLHLCGTLPTIGRLQLADGLTFEYCHFAGGGVLEDECQVARFKIANYVPDMKANMNADFAFEIFIKESPSCRLQDITNAMFLSVPAIRESFEKHFGIKR